MAPRYVCVLLLVHLLPALSLGAGPTWSAHQEPHSTVNLEQQLSLFLNHLARAVQRVEQQHIAQQQMIAQVQGQHAAQTMAMHEQQKITTQLLEQQTVQTSALNEQQQEGAQLQQQLNAVKGLITAGMTWELNIAEDADILSGYTAQRVRRAERQKSAEMVDKRLKSFFFWCFCLMVALGVLTAFLSCTEACDKKTGLAVNASKKGA